MNTETTHVLQLQTMPHHNSTIDLMWII